MAEVVCEDDDKIGLFRLVGEHRRLQHKGREQGQTLGHHGSRLRIAAAEGDIRTMINAMPGETVTSSLDGRVRQFDLQ